MRLKLTSNGTLAGTSLRDANGEAIQGIQGFHFTCLNDRQPSLTVSFIRVPFEVNEIELKRTGGDPVGTVEYYCGCARNYFATKDAPTNSEKCPYHGDAVKFSRVNLLQIKPAPVAVEPFGFEVD